MIEITDAAKKNAHGITNSTNMPPPAINMSSVRMPLAIKPMPKATAMTPKSAPTEQQARYTKAVAGPKFDSRLLTY